MSAEDDGKQDGLLFEPGVRGRLKPAKSPKKLVPKSYKMQDEIARKRKNKLVYKKRFKRITEQQAQQQAYDREDAERDAAMERDVMARAADAEARVEREVAERVAKRTANAARAAPRPADDVVDPHAFMGEMERGERRDRAPERAPPGFLERAALEPERAKLEAMVRERARDAADKVIDKMLGEVEKNRELARKHGQEDGTAHKCVIC
jgi:hypothetical protein